ncbi:hypothetical protein RHGRI_025682 [Rhododendron griersonianum]|uniref:Uncharacterized protein n=1 Tax=Rhododendron griersonianum TaxID=479676 RepID=A0AAV6IQ43_9ERIC|nr:hypothetical protein RHGRI_025682 [Rhododendron griersonianum]
MPQQDSTFEGPEPGITLYEEPKLEGTSIQYYKLGKLKDGVEVGVTSLSRSIEVSRATKINIVSFSNIEDMAAQFWTLRDILSGLREIYKRGYYHGMFLEGVAIKNNRAKLWNFRCAKPGKGHLARLHMPEDIGNFLKVLNDETLPENVDLSWLLNDPASWDKKKRRLWIADLWKCVNSSEKGTSGLFDTYLPLKHKKWRETVVEGSGWHDDVKRSEADKIRYREQSGGSEVDVDIDFHELTRFYGQSIEHYDRKQIRTREEIDQAINETFSYPLLGSLVGLHQFFVPCGSYVV